MVEHKKRLGPASARPSFSKASNLDSTFNHIWSSIEETRRFYVERENSLSYITGSDEKQSKDQGKLSSMERYFPSGEEKKKKKKPKKK